MSRNEAEIRTATAPAQPPQRRRGAAVALLRRGHGGGARRKKRSGGATCSIPSWRRSRSGRRTSPPSAGWKSIRWPRRSRSPIRTFTRSPIPASSRTRAASIRPAIAAASGPCASSPASAPPSRRTSASSTCSSQGQTGLSVAFHLPTLYGYDSDHHYSAGEVGKCGVAIDSLADMETLFDGINLEDVTVSMTINSTAPIALAMYLAVAEKQGADWKKIGGTLQNDILKEYIAQKEYIFPPRPSMRLITDTIKFCAENVPKYNTISISGYHIREAGSTALQELAFTLRDGMEYVEYARQARAWTSTSSRRASPSSSTRTTTSSKKWPSSAPRAASGPRSCATATARRTRARWMLRFHTQTAGCSLTAQQPYNNIVRVTIQALAAVLGGTQSLHTNSLDETLALPTEQAARIALRTQQIIAHESGVINTVDPLGGSYFIEELTDQMEKGCFEYIEKIDQFGGMVEAIEAGFPQREIWDASYQFQRAVDSAEKVVVGVNAFRMEQEDPHDILYIDESVTEQQMRAAEQGPRRARSAESAGRVAGAAQRRRRSEREHDAADHRGREGLRHGRRDLRRAARRVRDVSGAGAVLGVATSSEQVRIKAHKDTEAEADSV